MKVVFLILSFLCPVAVGIGRSMSLKKRYSVLSEFIRFLDAVNVCVRTEKIPASDIIEKSGFSLFSETEKNEDVSVYYADAKKKNFGRCGFIGSDGDMTDAFFYEFGRCDSESLLSLTASVRCEAEERLRSARNDVEKYSVMYTAFGFVSGAMLVILLI